MNIYVSTDIETDGPIPGDNSMMSFGSAAYNDAGLLLSDFTRNLLPLQGATPNKDTMEWWATDPDAYRAATTNQIEPRQAMKEYHAWLNKLGAGKLVFVGYPASFDFMFIYWYFLHFEGYCPFGLSALDMKTYASAILKQPFRKCTKKSMPKEWFNIKRKHTHIALDDAHEQGELFLKMLKANNV